MATLPNTNTERDAVFGGTYFSGFCEQAQNGPQFYMQQLPTSIASYV